MLNNDLKKSSIEKLYWKFVYSTHQNLLYFFTKKKKFLFLDILFEKKMIKKSVWQRKDQ